MGATTRSSRVSGRKTAAITSHICSTSSSRPSTVRLLIHDSGSQVTPLLIVSFGSGALGTQSTWYACTNARSGEWGSSSLVVKSRTPLAIGTRFGSLHSTTLLACDMGLPHDQVTVGVSGREAHGRVHDGLVFDGGQSAQARSEERRVREGGSVSVGAGSC